MFLPLGLLDHFDIVDSRELGDISSKKDCIYIYLDEKNNLPFGYNFSNFESNGFCERTIIEDFWHSW